MNKEIDLTKIEVVEFYPKIVDDERKIIFGTMHIYIIDVGIDLRGIIVKKRKNTWFFGLPQLWGIDSETHQKVFYPVVSFVNKEKEDTLRQTIIQKGKEYIINNFLKDKKRGTHQTI